MQDGSSAFTEIAVFVNVPDLGLRSSITHILRNNGVRSVEMGQSLAALVHHMDEAAPDLIISSVQFPDGDLCPKLLELRHNQWGRNPFVAVMTVVNEPSTDLVKTVLESGVDDLLVQPVSTKQLLDRIGNLAKNRKPFVVTTDYVGPTRRSGSQVREGSTEVPLIDVPNTLRSKITGEKSGVRLEDAIRATLTVINEQKVERHGVQLAYLAERIVDPENPDEMIVGSSPLLDKLINVAENTRTRMETTKYAHTAKLCVSLLEVANNIRDAGDDPASKDLNLLNPVANAIKVGFEDVGSANAAEEIADTMTKWD